MQQPILERFATCESEVFLRHLESAFGRRVTGLDRIHLYRTLTNIIYF
jgi:hypothetical protein